MVDTTVVISTIGRPTLPKAIESCLKNNFGVIVVADGVYLAEEIFERFKNEKVIFYRTGRRFANYGFMSFNLAAYLAETEFISCLGDDDEIMDNKGDVVRECLNSDLSVDIWIPGIQYNNGEISLIEENFIEGNIGSPILRTQIVANLPMRPPRQDEWYNPKKGGSDFWYVRELVRAGNKLKWIQELIIAVRPALRGGRGFSDIKAQGIMEFKIF